MKSTTLILSSMALFAFYACSNNSSTKSSVKEVKETVATAEYTNSNDPFCLAPQNRTVYIKEPIDVTLKEQVLNYKLYLDYASNTKWKLQNKHYSILHEWVNRFKKDSVINQLSTKEIDTTFIIDVEAGVSRNITPEIGRKRMEDVRRVISSMLGTNIDYDMEIIKVLSNVVRTKV